MVVQTNLLLNKLTLKFSLQLSSRSEFANLVRIKDDEREKKHIKMSIVHELGRAEDTFFVNGEKGNTSNLKENVE